MQKCTYTPDALPVVVPQSYFVVQYCEPVNYCPCNCFGIMFIYYDNNGEKFFCAHRGARTGELVTFSRLSDAERLCSVLNGQIAC